MTAITYNLRFPGQYLLPESGLYYNYYRDYDSAVGGYEESDPIGLNGGSYSTFAYVSNNPLSFYDPDGLCGTKTCVGKARVLKGNAKTIGKQGAFPGTTIASNSAAVIPGQFGLTKGQLTPYISRISGKTGKGLSINGTKETSVLGTFPEPLGPWGMLKMHARDSTMRGRSTESVTSPR